MMHLYTGFAQSIIMEATTLRWYDRDTQFGQTGVYIIIVSGQIITRLVLLDCTVGYASRVI